MHASRREDDMPSRVVARTVCYRESSIQLVVIDMRRQGPILRLQTAGQCYSFGQLSVPSLEGPISAISTPFIAIRR